MNKSGKEKEKRFLPGMILIAFIAAVATFFLMLHIEKNILSDYEKQVVWVAAADLQKSLEIKDTNINQCFVQTEIEKTKVPAYAVQEIESLTGRMTAIMIPEGTVLSEPMFAEEERYMDMMYEPVLVGCKADDLCQFVSGILRKGDRVDIFVINDESEEACLMWEDVRIYQAFDSAGNLIAAEDVTTAATRINLFMEVSDAEQFLGALQKGTLQIVKVWDI